MNDADFVPGDWVVHRILPLAKKCIGQGPDGPVYEPDTKYVGLAGFLLDKTQESLMVYIPSMDAIYGLPQTEYPFFQFATPMEVEVAWAGAKQRLGKLAPQLRTICEDLSVHRNKMLEFFTLKDKIATEIKPKGVPSETPFKF